MSVQRITTRTGAVRYKARVKFHGRQVVARQFERKADALAWEKEQTRRLQLGDWTDPRRARVSVGLVAESWLLTRDGVKRRTREADTAVWKRYVEPKFGRRPIGSITTAEVTEWAAQLVGRGLSAATARRALWVLRATLDHAVADERLYKNPVHAAKAPRGGSTREGQVLTLAEVEALRAACRGRYGDLVVVLAHTGLRWGELVGLQAGDRISVPGPGLRVQRAIGLSNGELYVDTLKTHRARTVPLTARAAEIVAEWSVGRGRDDWIFPSTVDTPLRVVNWQRMVDWPAAKQAIGRPTMRVHDLRHTAASIWLGAGADAKVVQRVLGHASATMTLDLYGHLIDSNLWAGAALIGDRLGTAPRRSYGGQ